MNNTVAQLLQVFGIVFIAISIICGLIVGSNDDLYMLGGLQSAIGWGIVLDGVVVGFLFIGIAEVIKLLQGIYNQKQGTNHNLAVSQSRSVSESINAPDETRSEDSEENTTKRVDERTQEKIEKFLNEKNITMLYVEGTSEEDVYFVKTNEGHEYVDLGGFRPILLPRDKKIN